MKMKDKKLNDKYNPQDFEEKLYQEWEEKEYFKPRMDKTKESYCIMMPPPNVTGKLHMGHALDDTIQDILIRFKRMQGYNTLWLPGSDHAAIATEVKVVEKMKKEEGLTKADITREQMAAILYRYANYKKIDTQVGDNTNILSYDDYNDVWVKNEWNRYLEIAEKNKNKCLIPCYKDVDEYDIPKEFAGLKVCQLGNDDTFNNIMAEIANVVKPESVNQPAPEPEKAEPAEEIELEEIEIIEPVDINKLLDEGFSAISDKNWKEANKLFFQVLDEEPDNSKAYWGQLLVQQECTNAREMADNLYLQVIGNTSDNTYELEIRDRRQEIKDKYPVANLFSEEEYANLFDVHFNYQSGVENTKSAIAANNEHYILSDNELFKRAKQNADAEVAAGIEEFVANVNRHLDEILKNVTEQEQQEIEEARQQETAYFSKLEDAFKKADDMANANLSNSEAEYQKDHDSWEYERDNLEEARQQWVKDVEEKQKEHDEWLAVNGVAIEEWNAKKKEYNDNKQKLEYELKRLQEDKGFIEGFMAGAKAAKKDKEIMNVRIELSRLALPKEPIMPKEPVIPPEPALRREPEKPDYDIMIGRNDVLDTFRSLMA